MSGSSIVSTGFWSSFNNPASIAFCRSAEAGFSLESRFGIPELTTRTAAITIPAKGSAAGARIMQYGFGGFASTTISLSAGVKIWETLYAGTAIYLVTERSTKEGVSRVVPVAETGLIVDLPGGPRIGISLFNPVHNFPAENVWPYSIKAGAGHSFTEEFFIAAMAEKREGMDLIIGLGIEYRIEERVPLRIGYCTYPAGFSAGAGYTWRRITTDFSFSSHPLLGITPSLSVVWTIPDGK